MEKVFWEDRWDEERIGFHQSVFNEYLLQFWPQVGAPEGAKVFVPLCGKTLDLHWLQQQGHKVLGNEVVDKAVDDFFREADLQPTREEQGGVTALEAKGICILLGDFFDLTAEHLEGVTAWYDRAAQVALPPETRKRYYAHLHSILPAGAVGLSLAFEYPQEEMPGPPFSIEESEIRKHYADGFKIELVGRRDRLAFEPTLKEKGLSRANEVIYLMERI
ncbi:MAG: thiopurine S-methyltransferase [Planctomycetota bacterium]|nr:thiopurine S-methyltransferase [Planctomycetota bacterium]MDA1114553.1 thiopurine S-methyltransferase [Planctomycetota bacterium]